MQLVPFDRSHYTLLASWLPDQRAAVQWGGAQVRYPLDPQQFDVMLAQDSGPQPARRSWMALADGEYVGHGQIAFDWTDGNARLGRILIAPAARGQGWAPVMLRQLIDHAFSHPEIQRVELNVYTFNTPAIHLYTRLGFRWEGVRRSSVPSGMGDERWDTGMMGLLRPEWPPAEGA